MKIHFTKEPSSEDVSFLTDRINEETLEFGRAEPFAFFARDDHGEIIAGVNCFLLYGTAFTDQLWVHQDYRNQGIARDLMNKVHAYGMEKGCKIATVQTMDFQGAWPFYEKLGYQVDFERSNYVKGARCFFMKRELG